MSQTQDKLIFMFPALETLFKPLYIWDPKMSQTQNKYERISLSTYNKICEYLAVIRNNTNLIELKLVEISKRKKLKDYDIGDMEQWCKWIIEVAVKIENIVEKLTFGG